MILLHENEGDDIADVCVLVIDVCLEAHDRNSYRQPTTLEGLYWIMPPGPPTVTWIWADFTGRAAMKPSKAERTKRLENITGKQRSWCAKESGQGRGVSGQGK